MFCKFMINLYFRKIGTVVEISKDTVTNAVEGSSGRTVYTVNTLLGMWVN